MLSKVQYLRLKRNKNLHVNQIPWKNMYKALPCSGCFTTCMGVHFPVVRLDNTIGSVPFPGCQGSCVIVPNGPASSVVSFNMYQGLKFYQVASTPTLTMRFYYVSKLASTKRRSWNSKLAFWVYSQKQIFNSSSAFYWTHGPLLNFPAKYINFGDLKLNILELLSFCGVITQTHLLPA